MPFTIERRAVPSRAMLWLSPLVAIALTVLAGALLFALLGRNPLTVLEVFFIQPLADAYGVTELLVKASPLALCALGLSIGFRAGTWNIGAEGQLIVGAICGGAVALAFHGIEGGPWVGIAMALAGVLGGMAWAGIAAWLRTAMNVNEILTTLMLTYVAALLLSYLVHGPMRDPDGYNFPESRLFEGAALLPIIAEGTRLHLGVLVAPFAAVAAWVLLTRSLLGYQLRVIGDAPAAARYAGFSPAGLTWFCLLLSGGLAGLAGNFEVAGPVGQLVPTVSPGYGFTAIIVAFVGRLHPVGILLASLLMALSYLGGEMAQMNAGLPSAVTGVFQGLLLFFLLAADLLVTHRIRFGGAVARAEAA